MTERRPDNLKLLYGDFGEELIDSILPGDSFVVDGVEFVCKYTTGSTADRFYIVKSQALVARYRELCERFHGANIVELGIAEGGSTALMAMLAEPGCLVAVDLEPERLVALDEFTARRGLGDVLHAHYGVDQSDAATLAAVVDGALAGRPLDLVVDDCSHQYEPTRASFECLFPRLRPGGIYVIEDWNLDHVFRDGIVDYLRNPDAPKREETMEQMRAALVRAHEEPTEEPRPPLARLAMELAVARCSLTDLIASVTLDEYWIVVERGPGTGDTSDFRLDDLVRDHFGFLAT